MKIFVNILVAITTLSLGSVAVADAKTLVITGRVVQLDKQNITVESGPEASCSLNSGTTEGQRRRRTEQRSPTQVADNR